MVVFLNRVSAQSQEPYVYFGYEGLDSLARNQLLELDTLKMNNPVFKIEKFTVALSSAKSGETSDVRLIEVKGNALSNNIDLYKSLKTGSDKIYLTIMDIDFINSKGKLIHYPKKFSFFVF